MSKDISPSVLGGEGPRDDTTFLRGDDVWAVPPPTPPQSATAVPFDPVGDLAATDVQAAIAELDLEKAKAVHFHETGKFKGEWAPVSDELVYSHDFSTGLAPFTGAGVQTAMASAIGSNKPAYSHVSQAGSSTNSPPLVVAELDLASIPETVGRSLTRMKVHYGRYISGTSGTVGIRAGKFTLQTGAGVAWTETVYVASGNPALPWQELEILNPSGVFQAIVANGTGHTTSLPTRTMAVTGVELYANPTTGLGYAEGEFVTHQGRLWRSAVAGNTAEPSASDPSWIESPLYRDRALHTGTQPASTVTGLAAVATSGSASDIVVGTLPNSVLPPLAISDTFAVGDEATMLALNAQVGDVAVRTDLSKSFILAAEPASTLANWQELLTPSGGVASVDGRTGVVSLADLYADDVHTHTRNQITDAGNAIAYNVAASGDAAVNEVVLGSDTRLTGRGVLAYQATVQTIPHATDTAVILDAEKFDTHAYHDLVTNNSRLTVPSGAGGKYLVIGQVRFDTNGTGTRVCYVLRNGTAIESSSGFPAGTTYRGYALTACVVHLADGDYIQMFAYQNSGGDLSTNLFGVSTFLAAYRQGG